MLTCIWHIPTDNIFFLCVFKQAQFSSGENERHKWQGGENILLEMYFCDMTSVNCTQHDAGLWLSGYQRAERGKKIQSPALSLLFRGHFIFCSQVLTSCWQRRVQWGWDTLLCLQLLIRQVYFYGKESCLVQLYLKPQKKMKTWIS